MRYLFSVVMIGWFIWSSSFFSSAIALADVTPLGIKQGQLSPCPSSPNCVVSQADDSAHRVEPLVYHGDLNTAREVLLKVLSVVPRTVVVEQTDNYIRAESTSRIFHFVDDVEFYFPVDEQVIHVRSASRVGESDLGVNRRRIEQIRLALKDLGV